MTLVAALRDVPRQRGIRSAILTDLFSPLSLGDLVLPNRMIMAPLTRSRATPERVPTPMMSAHYVQRAGAGLIIAEATNVAMQSNAWECAPGIFTRVSSLCARIKKHSAYTDAIGQDLDLIGAEHTVDTANAKPALKLELLAGHPNVKWSKGPFDALELWGDHGTGIFTFLAIDLEPDYLDNFPLPSPGTSAVWKYKAIYRLHDEQVGHWSDVVSIAVQG